MLKAAGTWRLEEMPAGVNVTGSKQAFKAKQDATGNARNKVQGASSLMLHPKQSSHHWYQILSLIFISLDPQECTTDQAFPYKADKDLKKVTVAMAHADDHTTATSSKELTEELPDGLPQHLKATDPGVHHWVPGIETQQDHKSGPTRLPQQVYINNTSHLLDLKTSPTPMDTSV